MDWIIKKIGNPDSERFHLNRILQEIRTAVNSYQSSGVIWEYKTKTTSTSGYPGDGRILWNNATQVSATSLLLSHLTNDSIDYDILLSYIAIGDTLVIQAADDSSSFQIWTVSGTPTNTNPNTSTSYWTVPITLDSSGGTGTTNFANNHTLIVIKVANVAASSGDVVGPVSAVNNRVVFFDGVTGKLIKDSGLTLSGTNTGDQTITLTGDVTGSGTGSFAGTIANNAITLAKMATMATASFLGRSTAGTGNVEVLSASTARSILATGAPNVVTAVSSSAGVLTLDLSLGVFFTCTLTENITSVVFSNAPSSGFGTAISIQFTQHASAAKTITGWPANLKWFGGTYAISTATGAIDEVGVTYYSSTAILGKYAKAAA